MQRMVERDVGSRQVLDTIRLGKMVDRSEASNGVKVTMQRYCAGETVRVVLVCEATVLIVVTVM